MTIIVDSDGLIGSLNQTDAHHSIANKVHSQLASKHAKLIYPATVIAECVTFLQGRLNNPELANEIIQLVIKNELNIEPVDFHILKEASLTMNLRASKHHTLFDAIVLAIAQKHNADAIFSFDKFYKSKGFKLASEL